MLAIASLLLVIALSLLFVRVGAIALTMTGVSEDVAKFQSLSAFSGALARLTRPLFERVLKNTPALDLRDYAALLHLRDNWRVAEFQLDTSSRFVGQSLRDLWLRDSQVIVLGIGREDGSREGVPSLDQPLESGDTLLVYGEGDMLATVSKTDNLDQG